MKQLLTASVMLMLAAGQALATFQYQFKVQGTNCLGQDMIHLWIRGLEGVDAWLKTYWSDTNTDGYIAYPNGMTNEVVIQENWTPVQWAYLKMTFPDICSKHSQQWPAATFSLVGEWEQGGSFSVRSNAMMAVDAATCVWMIAPHVWTSLSEAKIDIVLLDAIGPQHADSISPGPVIEPVVTAPPTTPFPQLQLVAPPNMVFGVYSGASIEETNTSWAFQTNLVTDAYGYGAVALDMITNLPPSQFFRLTYTNSP